MESPVEQTVTLLFHILATTDSPPSTMTETVDGEEATPPTTMPSEFLETMDNMKSVLWKLFRAVYT
jgi:hypothetical protein